ncbi:MAG: hypothetical protein H8E87_03265 [FCB group bacterium]|nr:hypothetical protein [FCB group bacterium]
MLLFIVYHQPLIVNYDNKPLAAPPMEIFGINHEKLEFFKDIWYFYLNF